MRFTGTIFLFLVLFPAIYYSTCECLPHKNHWGSGGTECVDDFCYVKKEECRKVGVEVHETTSYKILRKNIIGCTYDVCWSPDVFQHKTQFCGCLGKYDENDQGGSCRGTNWCYINKIACSEYLDDIIDLKDWVKPYHDDEPDFDYHVIGKSKTICTRMKERTKDLPKRCECAPYIPYKDKGTCMVDNVEDCEFEGVKVDGAATYPDSRHMFEIQNQMEKNGKCMCLQGTTCTGLGGAAPYCIVDKDKCEKEGFLVTPLQERDTIKKGIRKDYGRSQQFCKRVKDRHLSVEVFYKNLKWVVVGYIESGLSTMEKTTIIDTESNMSKIENEEKTISKTDWTSSTKLEWKITTEVAAKLKIFSAKVNAAHGRKDESSCSTSKIEDSLNKTSHEYFKSKTTKIEKAKTYTADNNFNRIIYELQIKGETVGNTEVTMFPAYRHICKSENIENYTCKPPGMELAMRVMNLLN